MLPHTPTISETWQWSESELREWQLQRFNELLEHILPENPFYREKLGEKRQLTSLNQLANLPYTTKEELVASTEVTGFSQHHTYAPNAYSRMHRTSGTTGKPLMILESAEDWQRWSAIWQHVLEAAEISNDDRVFLAFSFGPFVGFWSAHQACVDSGALVIPGGGLSSLARLEFLRDSEATVLCGTPTYLMHLAEIARENSIHISDLAINRLIVAGESGGSVPTVRAKLEADWDAQVIDHSGATEIGPWGFGWPDRPGLHIIETHFIAELEPIDEAESSKDSKETLCELVLTSLSRFGAPVIRYRTGDAIIAERPTEGACRFLWLPKGVVGRADNMLTIRGVNVFPSNIDAVVRGYDNISEYQVNVTRAKSLDQLELLVEADESTRAALEHQLTLQIGLRVPVQLVETGSLPRSELKSRRWRDLRRTD